MPVMVMDLPVGTKSMKAPLCMPRAVKRAATLSSSATISSTVTFRCSKADLHAVITSFIPLIPGADGRGVCRAKFGASNSSAALKSPLDGPSSKKRSTMRLLSSIDIDYRLLFFLQEFRL